MQTLIDETLRTEASAIVEFVTPELAEKYLATMGLNRPLSESWCSTLTREIVQHRFVFTHQAIAFDTEGHLFDGQHRLQAIIRAKTGIHLLVVRGLSSDALLNTDTGHRRTLAHIAYLSGVEQDPHVVEVATFLCQREYGIPNPSMMEVRSFLRVHAATIMQGNSIMRRKHTFGSVPMQAAMAKAVRHSDENRLKEFVALLPEPTTSDPADQGVVLLHKFIMNAKKAESRPDRVSLYGRTLWALNAFTKREPIKRLIDSGPDPFPMSPVPELEEEDDTNNGNGMN